eukprot:6172288-Pleurochrysis_carterae.AAC.2
MAYDGAIGAELLLRCACHGRGETVECVRVCVRAVWTGALGLARVGRRALLRRGHDAARAHFGAHRLRR